MLAAYNAQKVGLQSDAIGVSQLMGILSNERQSLSNSLEALSFLRRLIIQAYHSGQVRPSIVNNCVRVFWVVLLGFVRQARREASRSLSSQL